MASFGNDLILRLFCYIINDLCWKQVIQVVQKTQGLKRISFLAHSLGGLFARYAIAVLYTPDPSNSSQSDDLKNSKKANSQTSSYSRRGMIAGLEPINFITLATPHLGVRGRKQVCSNGYSLYYWYYYMQVNQNYGNLDLLAHLLIKVIYILHVLPWMDLILLFISAFSDGHVKLHVHISSWPSWLFSF